MKTIITNKKSNLLKLTKVLMVAALISLGFKANSQCVANYSYSVSPANDGVVSFTNTSTTGSGPYYSWSFGDGSYSYAISPTHTYAATGTYTACLIIYDSISSCTDSICNSFTVTNNSVGGSCSASFVAFDSSGYGYFMNTSSGTGLTSTWDFGDGSTGTSTGDITHLYAGPGTYYACLTVSNTFLGCSNTFCDTVRIAGASSGSCLGIVNTYFTATDSAGYAVFQNTPSGAGQVYFWNFGDGTSSSDVGNTNHYYGISGTYLVCLTVYETGGSYDSCTSCSYVTIGSAGLPCDASFTIVQDSSNAFNYFVYNNSASGSSSMTYFWDFGDGTSSTLQFPTHTYPSTGPYYLCLTVSDSTPTFSCTNTYCDSLAAGHASVGVTVQVVNTATGISETEIASVLENYPNPFNGSTTINYSIAKDANVELSIIDLLGNKVASLEHSNKSAGGNSVVWNADGVAEGMYLLQMHVNNQVTTKKIILSK